MNPQLGRKLPRSDASRSRTTPGTMTAPTMMMVSNPGPVMASAKMVGLGTMERVMGTRAVRRPRANSQQRWWMPM